MLMASNLIIGFLPGTGARCGKAYMQGIGGSIYPICLMIMWLFNIFFMFLLLICAARIIILTKILSLKKLKNKGYKLLKINSEFRRKIKRNLAHRLLTIKNSWKIKKG